MIGLDDRTIGLSTTERQIISREVPEPSFTNRTRQVKVDLTHPSVRFSHRSATRAHGADASVRQHGPDAAPARPVARYR
jgi:hypothetical protein